MHAWNKTRVVGWVLAVSIFGWPAAGADWTQWRGPARDGHIAGINLPQVWPPALREQWKIEVGQGHASPLVAGDRVFQFSRQGEEEVVRAVRLSDGRPLWLEKYPAPFEMSPYATSHGKGPKSTPALAGDRLVTLGIGGILSCWDAPTGRLLWRHDSSKEYARGSSIWYGQAHSPMIDGGLVIAHLGTHDQGALSAFDLASGEARWRWTGDGPGYASPIAVELAGIRQVITQSQRACIGLSETDGKPLWSIPFTTEYDQNIVTPVVAGDLLIFSGTGKGTTAYRLEKQSEGCRPQEVWHNEEVSMFMSSPVVVVDRLVGFAGRQKGHFFALDVRTGKILWTGPGRQGDNAAILASGQTVLALTSRGELVVFRADANEYEQLARYKVAETATWAHPAVVPGKILVKDVERLALWSFD